MFSTMLDKVLTLFTTPMVSTGTTVKPILGVTFFVTNKYIYFKLGFAPQGQGVSRTQCDTNSGDQRLCWHTVSNNAVLTGGYRCGNYQGLNSDTTTWRRAILVNNNARKFSS
jgi:hypothetical protein